MCSIQFVKQSSVPLARAFSQNTRSLLVEQALLSIEAKLVQPASPCFQCNHLQVPENLPEWLLFDFLTWLRRGKASCYTPGWQLNSKAIPFKLDHVIPSDELTHGDSRQLGMLQCTAKQMFKCRLLTAAVQVNQNYWISKLLFLFNVLGTIWGPTDRVLFMWIQLDRIHFLHEKHSLRKSPHTLGSHLAKTSGTV